MTDPQLGDRVRGVLLGQAIGDALGFGTEFMPKADVAKTYPGGLRDYRQLHDRFQPCEQWQAGDWTDDTDLMLCILDSLLEREAVDLGDIASRFREWAFRDGYGMGRTVYAVVRADDYLHNPTAVARRYWEESGCQAAANGAIMRTSVLGLWDWHDADKVRRNAEAVCQLTHADPRCLGSCVAVCLAIRLLLLGETNLEKLLEQVMDAVCGYHPEMEVWLRMAQANNLEALDLDEGMNPGEQNRHGYTLKTLAAGFHALLNARTFAEGLLAIIHEAGDADTNAAVAGALLGARFGALALEPRWVEELIHRDALEERLAWLVGLVCRSWR